MVLKVNDLVRNMALFMESHYRTVDELAEKYVTEKGRIQGSSMLSAEGIAAKLEILDNETKNTMNTSRGTNTEKVQEWLEQIRRIATEWICEPADPSLVTTLATLRSLEVDLSHHEIQAFAEMGKDNYFSLRILQEIDKLGIVEAPHAKDIFDQINRIENMAMLGLTGYSGKDWELLDLLPDRIWRNVNWGKQTVISTAGAPKAYERVLEGGLELEKLASVTIVLPDAEEDVEE